MLLPLLALPLRVKMPATTLALALGAAIWLAAWAPDPMLCLPFVGGMAVALLVRMPRIVALLRHRASAAAAMAARRSQVLRVTSCDRGMDYPPRDGSIATKSKGLTHAREALSEIQTSDF